MLNLIYVKIFEYLDKNILIIDFMIKHYKMTINYLKFLFFFLFLYFFLLTLINSPSHAGGQTYSHTKAHCILWDVALGGNSAECRRRAIKAAASPTTCRLRHHCKAKSGETCRVYQKQGFFDNDKKILISTKHCPITYQCNRKVR